MADTAPLSARILLARLADELGRLHRASLALQDVTGGISAGGQARRDAMKDLQKMDLMTQTIADLERVTRWMAIDGGTQSFAIERLREEIRLGELGERLTGPQVNPTIRPNSGDGEVSLF